MRYAIIPAATVEARVSLIPAAGLPSQPSAEEISAFRRFHDACAVRFQERLDAFHALVVAKLPARPTAEEILSLRRDEETAALRRRVEFVAVTVRPARIGSRPKMSPVVVA